MQFKITTIVLSALAALASAQNSFNIPTGGYALTAGQSQTFTWANLQGSTVTLSLRQGPSNNLGAPTVIAQSIPNTGTFTWNVPSSTVQGSNYAIQITDDQNTSMINFTPQFTITSNVLSSSVAASSSSVVAASSSAVATSRATTTSTSVVLVTATTARTTLVTGASSIAPIATTNGTFSSTKPTGTSAAASSASAAPTFATGGAGTIAVSAGAGIAVLVAGFAALV